MRPVEFVKIDHAVTGLWNKIGGNDRKVYVVDAASFRMRPNSLIAITGCITVEPDGVYDPAYRVKRPLAAHAVYNQNRGALSGGARTIVAIHGLHHMMVSTV